MKLNQLPNFRTEDFPSEQSWISKLFVQLNPFISAVNQLFDRNIDYTDNIKTVTQEYTLNSGFQQIGLKWPYPNIAPVELRIASAFKGTQLSPCILLPQWSYDSSTNVITIKDALEVSSTGVAAMSGSYKFTVRASI